MVVVGNLAQKETSAHDDAEVDESENRERRPDTVVGDLALLDGEPRSADAVAHEDAQILLLQREEFLRYVDSRPKVARKLLTVLTRRLRRNARQIQDTAYLDVPARLARTMLELAQAESGTDTGKLAITSGLTQTDLAGMVGTSRESVNKCLSYYEQKGWITREKWGRIAIVRPEELRRRIY